jgi:crossover junction endodeoxyribonuclease RuvC
VRVLGIDPGSNCTGYGILDEHQGKMSVVICGVIRVSRGPLANRLSKIFSSLKVLLRDHQPDAVAVEEVFSAANARSALILGHARGVALLAAGEAGIAVHEYPTRKVKQTVTGSGSADKTQVRKVLGLLLGTMPKQLDATDALAVALCHLRWARFNPAEGKERVR